jgi:hypothetical protein
VGVETTVDTALSSQFDVIPSICLPRFLDEPNEPFAIEFVLSLCMPDNMGAKARFSQQIQSTVKQLFEQQLVLTHLVLVWHANLRFFKLETSSALFFYWIKRLTEVKMTDAPLSKSYISLWLDMVI